MDNVLETTGVPLTVFGGAVPELAPEDLPEGASPWNQDVDFNPGSVFTRGGRFPVYSYTGAFIEKLTGSAITTPGLSAPNEVPWGNPNNASLNTPGTYATVALNGAAVPVGVGTQILFSDANTGAASENLGTFTPTSAGEVAIWSSIAAASPTIAPGTQQFAGTGGSLYTNPVSIATAFSATFTAGLGFCSVGQLFNTNGNFSLAQKQGQGQTGFGAGSTFVTPALNFGVPSTHAVICALNAITVTLPISLSVTDDQGNVYTQLGIVTKPPANAMVSVMWICTNPKNGPKIFKVTNNGAGWVGGSVNLYMMDVAGLAAGVGISQILQSSAFGFSIPTTSVIVGAQVEISGNQTLPNADAILSVQLMQPNGTLGGKILTTQLPAADGTVFVGTPGESWGIPLTPALLNNPLFAVNIVASAPGGESVGFNIYAVKLKIFTAPAAANFNYLKTYEQTNGQINTLALDSTGSLWQENVNGNPNVMNPIFQNILANSFAKSVTFANIEYIAFSNLINGTDIPRQYNGTNFDRISMVGPGAAPTVASSGGSGGGTVAIQSITQYAPVMIRRIAWGTVNSPNDSTPGNLLVVFGEGRTGSNTYQSLFPYTAIFGAGTTVVLSGIPVPFPRKDSGTLPYNINGTYTVQQVTTGIVGGNESCPIFTIPSPTTIWAYSADFGSGGPPPTSNWFYQSCLATITMQASLPNVGVGSSIQITGTGGSPPSGYDGTWTVLQAPNASNMTINSAQLTGGSCTFSYTLVAGSVAPTVGQTVTITNCLNNGLQNPNPNVFNGNFQIASVGGNNFTVAIGSGDTGFQNQVGNPVQASAVVGGTQFVFDAAQIVGTKSGGTVVGQGQIGVGVRKVCYSFLTRSGFLTQPSPIATFNVTSGSGAITVSNLATGPPNVVARIVHFTGANGGNFFYIPQTVNVSVGGINQVNTSTMINDNSSTTQTFTFSDAVLLSATAIDIPGNNLFNTIELGSSRGLLTYASRMIAWGEQNKVTNLRNLSFDGGFQGVSVQGATIQVPLGWQLDATNGSGGSLNQNSPVFGWAYQIQNTSGSTQGSWGMLEQQAYQDEFGVPIIQAATAYSVRIAAQVTPVPASGNLVVDLINSQTGVVPGTFSLPLNSMTTTMGLYTGTLLLPANVLQPVPSTLYIRIWAQNIPNNTTILIDRVEPFPTLAPSSTTALKMSYVNNQEAFDLLTGVCGPAQNMQPINGTMELFDLLYALKEKSWFSTFDNGVTEPNKWNWKEVSNKVGSIGQNSYDWGEGWALTGNRQGVYFFEGGEPIKVSQEIAPLWDLINWQYGYTMWLRNDPEQKRFMVGVPIPTPNVFMPEFPVNANPTSPNVVLMCNYRELNTGAAMAQTGPIRSTYTGRLMSPEPARKWSFWNILCPYSDYIDRGNNQWPQMYGTGYLDSKIFQLLSSQLSDDGTAINSFTITYGFVKPEMQDAKGMGLYRMIFPYFTVLVTGSGTLNSYVYPESPQNQPYVLQPQPLPSISQGDLEIGVNVKGQRFFVRVGTNAVGSAFRCSKMVVPLIADTWSPIRGYNVVTA